MEEKRGSPWLQFLGTLTVAGLIGAVLAVIGIILSLALIGFAVVWIVVQVKMTGP